MILKAYIWAARWKAAGGTWMWSIYISESSDLSKPYCVCMTCGFDEDWAMLQMFRIIHKSGWLYEYIAVDHPDKMLEPEQVFTYHRLVYENTK
jgi:hypothetical protein